MFITNSPTSKDGRMNDTNRNPLWMAELVTEIVEDVCQNMSDRYRYRGPREMVCLVNIIMSAYRRNLTHKQCAPHNPHCFSVSFKVDWTDLYVLSDKTCTEIVGRYISRVRGQCAQVSPRLSTKDVCLRLVSTSTLGRLRRTLK